MDAAATDARGGEAERSEVTVAGDALNLVRRRRDALGQEPCAAARADDAQDDGPRNR